MPTVYSPPVSTYTALATYTVTGSPDAEVEFSSIPATYRDLVVVMGGKASAGQQGTIQLNGSNTSIYSEVVMLGFSGGATSYTGSGTSFAQILNNTTSDATIINIMDYSATDKHKTLLYRSNSQGASTIAVAGRWASTEAVHTVTIGIQGGANYSVGSVFSLYGIAS
jgi:hypothetical protein